jgi:hypothetical protein
VAERDLNLQLKIAKDEARAAVADFGRDTKAVIDADLRLFQAAEAQKVTAAKGANASALSDTKASLNAELAAAREADLARVASTRKAETDRQAAIKASRAEFLTELRTAAEADLSRGASAARTEAGRQSAIKATRAEFIAELRTAAESDLARSASAAKVEAGKQAAIKATRAEFLAELQAAADASVARMNATKAAGAATVAAAAKSTAAVAGTTAATHDGVAAFMKLQVAGQVFSQIGSWAREAMQAVARSVEEARGHIKGMVDEMERARTESKELAALRGEKATAGFTAQLAREAAGAGLDTGKYNEFQLGFQAYTGQYVGKSEATKKELAAGGQKMNKEQAEQLQQRVASYSVGARGLSADDSAKLLGTVVAKSQAGASNDQIMSEYAKLMKIMELAPGKTSPLIGQLAEVGMESVGPEGDFTNLQQAGYLTRVMAQRNPMEASTYSRAMLRGLRDIGGDESKRNELGITRDMDVMQQLEQINVKAQQHVAGGGKEGEFIQKYFPEIREWGAVKTALNEGLRGGGFQRAQDEAASVNETTAQAETVRYQGGREGIAARQRSELQATDRERAGKYEALRQIQRDQAIALHGSGELELPENVMNSILTGSGSLTGMGGRDLQQVNKLTATRLNQGLEGYAEGRQYLVDKYGTDKMGGGREPGKIRDTTPEAQMAEAARLLERLANAAEARRNNPAPTPLVNPPQARGGVRQ